jgi:hypothetical protein
MAWEGIALTNAETPALEAGFIEGTNQSRAAKWLGFNTALTTGRVSASTLAIHPLDTPLLCIPPTRIYTPVSLHPVFSRRHISGSDLQAKEARENHERSDESQKSEGRMEGEAN